MVRQGLSLFILGGKRKVGNGKVQPPKRNTHPNLVNLWMEYIKVKRISYLKSIVDCESMISNLTNSRDISPETIAMLYALFE